MRYQSTIRLAAVASSPVLGVPLGSMWRGSASSLSQLCEQN